MYLNLQFHRRSAASRYRLDKGRTQRLRSRTDYPRGFAAGDAVPDGGAADGPRLVRTTSARPRGSNTRLRRAHDWLRQLPTAGWLAAAAVLAFGLFGIFGRSKPVGCRAEDFGVTTLPTLSDASVEEDAPRTVYLTFDDGPSENTEKVLNILKEAGVPATFFVVGAENNEEYLPLLERTLAEGHCIGLHSCTHEYRKIYDSAESYWTDIEALKMKLAAYCGDYSFSVLRFPGGSSNTVSHKYGGSGIMDDLTRQAAEKGYRIVDWNVSAEDSVGGHPSANTIASRVLKGCKGKTSAIILMHDSSTNSASAEALPVIIDWLKENGYTFDTVDHLPAEDDAPADDAAGEQPSDTQDKSD